MATLPGTVQELPAEEESTVVADPLQANLPEIETDVAVEEPIAPVEEPAVPVEGQVTPPEEDIFFNTDVGDIEEDEPLSEADQARERLKVAPPGAKPNPEAEQAKRRLKIQSGDVDTRSALEIVNAGISDLLDLPIDVIMSMSNAIVQGLSAEEIFGLAPKGSFRRFFEAQGYTVPEGQLPKGALADAFRFLGQSIAGLPILGALGLTKIGQAVKTITSRSVTKPISGATEKLATKEGLGFTLKQGAKTAGAKIGAEFAEKPLAMTALELTSGFTAGLGFGTFGKDSPTAQFLGGIVGGITPAVSLSILKGFQFGLFGAINRIHKSSFTEGGGNVKAANRLDEVLEVEGDVIVKKMGEIEVRDKVIDPFDATKTPAQNLEDGGLYSMEITIMNSDPKLKKKMGEQHALLNEIIIKSMDEAVPGANPEMTRKAFVEQSEYLKAVWKDRQNMARIQALEDLEAAGPNVTKEQATRIVRRHLDAAWDDALETQKQVWDQVGEEAVDPTPLLDAWKKILKEFSKDNLKSDLHLREETNYLFDRLGRIGENGDWIPGSYEVGGKGFTLKGAKLQLIKDLQAMRSVLLNEQRGVDAIKNTSNKSRILTDLQQTIMKMFEDVEGGGILMRKNADGVYEGVPPTKSILHAIGFSRQLNTDFNQGELKNILGMNKDGSPAVFMEKTMETLLVGSDTQTAKNLDDLYRAITRETEQGKLIGDVDSDPANLQPVIDAVGAYIKHEFNRMFVFEGKVSIRAASKWMTKNHETLKRVPGLTKELRDVIKSGESEGLLTSENKNVQKLLTNPKRAAAIMWIHEEPIHALDKMFKSPRQAKKDMAILVRRAKRDKSGKALAGLQQSIFDWVLKNSSSTGENAVSSAGHSFVSGQKMTLFLSNKGVKAIMEKGLTIDQIKRMDQIRGHAMQLDAIRKSPELTKIISKGWLAALIGKLGGARVGRYINKLEGGGGDIQTPGAMSQRGKAFMESVFRDYPKIALIDAFTDPDPKKLEALLTLPTTKENIIKLGTALNSSFLQYLVLHNINTQDYSDQADEDAQLLLESAGESRDMEQGIQ